MIWIHLLIFTLEEKFKLKIVFKSLHQGLAIMELIIVKKATVLKQICYLILLFVKLYQHKIR